MPADRSDLRDHAVIVGYGRVGSAIGEALTRDGIPFAVVEQDRTTVEELRRDGIPAVFGDGTRPETLELVQVARARLLIVAAPDPYQARQIFEIGRKMNAKIDTVVRTHSAGAQAYFERLGVGRAFMGEHELASAMTRHVLERMGRGVASA